jgi:superfamily II DNA helicase RecQ
LTGGVENAGIDSPNVRSCIRIDFPPSALDFNQELGRVGRSTDAQPSICSYNVFISFETFIMLFERIWNLDEAVIDKTYRKEQEVDLLHFA